MSANDDEELPDEENTLDDNDGSELNKELDAWLGTRNITTSAESITKGIDIGMFISLSDALGSEDDVEIVYALKQIKGEYDKRSLLDRAEEELEEGIDGLSTDGMDAADTGPTLQSVNDLQRKLDTSPQGMEGTVNTGSNNETMSININDINIDESDPTKTLVSISDPTKPNDTDLVPLDSISVLEGLARMVHKQALYEYKTKSDVFKHDIAITNEEAHIIDRIKNSEFLKEKDLGMREGKVCNDLHRKGIITKSKMNGTVGYMIGGKS